MENFSQIVRFERKATAQVVVHLAEIYDRRLYAREGYSSLFSYIKEKFNYSGSSAYRRIQAARLSLRFPEIIDLLISGKLNLVAICLSEPHMTAENGKELISQAIGKTKEEIEYQLAQQFPKIEKTEDKLRRLPVIKRVVPVQERPDSEKGHFEGGIPEDSGTERSLRKGHPASGELPLGGLSPVTRGISIGIPQPSGPRDDLFSGAAVAQESKKIKQTETIEIRRVKLECVVDEAVAKKLERAKEVLRAKYPKGRFEDILNEALDALLDKKDPERKIERGKRKEVSQNNRHAIEEKSGGHSENQSNCHSEERSDEESLRFQPGDSSPWSQDERNFHTRYIPARLRQEIWQRDLGMCTFVSPAGKRCGERGNLHFDHVHPFSLGGGTDKGNLRMLCRTHNLYRSQQTFGRFQQRT